MYIFMFIFIFILTLIFTFVLTLKYIFISTFIYMYIIYILIHLHIYMYIYLVLHLSRSTAKPSLRGEHSKYLNQLQVKYIYRKYILLTCVRSHRHSTVNFLVIDIAICFTYLLYMRYERARSFSFTVVFVLFLIVCIFAVIFPL